MSRKLFLLAVLGILLWTPLRAQEQQPSLGDIARQARKAKEDREKNASAPKAIITEDSLPSSKSANSPDLSKMDDPKASPSERLAAGRATLDRAARALDILDPMDRTTLAKLALEGRDVDFPGRHAWEDKLYSAKQFYVSHGRDLFREINELLGQAQSLVASGKPASTDPRVQDLSHRARQLMQDAFQTEANFQAVVLEGQDLAKQAGSH